MTPHHYSGDPDVIKRFLDQAENKAEPEFPDGRLNPQDEGSLAFAIAADLKSGIVRIDFNKPVAWIGLDLTSARKLRELLAKTIALLEIAPPVS